MNRVLQLAEGDCDPVQLLCRTVRLPRPASDTAFSGTLIFDQVLIPAHQKRELVAFRERLAFEKFLGAVEIPSRVSNEFSGYELHTDLKKRLS